VPAGTHSCGMCGAAFDPPADPGLLALFSTDPTLALDVVAGAPERVPDAPEVRVTELTYQVTAEHRSVATLAAGPGAGPVGVVVAHGGTEDGRHWFVPEAVALARRGCAVLLTATDFPAHGDVAASERAVRTGVLTQRRALDVLTWWAGADPGRLRFYGHSGGAFQGAILSAVEPRLDGLVLASSGSGTLSRLAAEELREREGAPGYLAALARFDPARYVAVAGRRHLLFQHGRDDRTVRRDEARRLYGNAAGHRAWREYPCGHATTAHPEATEDRAAFLAAPAR
jgi:pimeloyl-ACP methyl ester carboxylesterase